MKAALVGLWLLSVLVVVKMVKSVVAEPRIYGQDSHAYWLAAQAELVYSRPAGTLDAYLYSPVFLTLIKPLTWLPWPVFLAAWTVLLLAIVVWLVRPLSWKWAVPLAVCCLPEVLVNNIFLLLALAAVVGMRWPALWAFPILTKVTMGVGLLWFAARGEWWSLIKGIGVTALIVAVAYAVDPLSWQAWVHFLLSNRDGTKDGLALFALRCLGAVVLVVVGARLNWPWLVAPAMLLASPVLVSIVSAALLAAIPRLAMLNSAGPPPVQFLNTGEDMSISKSPLGT
ncbi:glycosyltransferase family 87 protein [Kocuria rosea]|uniref:glycosyltransferase family 87 protein n=1 Tax=Kocuria rosea TaxID=1275 RepID=UPI0025408FAC|nr:glycosyltransferase family 87 protein [Kocuria rosea]WIG18105.1 glycosyltransferase family 87 protein [Kocuria rosea]